VIVETHKYLLTVGTDQVN